MRERGAGETRPLGFRRYRDGRLLTRRLLAARSVTLEPLRGASLFALATLLALAFSGAAQAANPIPNPGFETSAGDPCDTPAQWSPLGGSFGCPAPIVRDTSTRNSGAASAKVFVDAQSSSDTPDLSDCFPLTGGAYNASYAYSTDSAGVSGTKFLVRSYTDATGCKGIPTTLFLNVSTTQSGWHLVSGPLSFPAGTHFGAIQIGCTCPVGTINFDDVSLQATGPTAVTVTGFRATRTGARAVLRWNTTAEAGIAGFHVFRETAGRLTRVDRRLIAAARGPQSFVDPAAQARRATYRLQAVRLDGTRRWVATATLSR
jgi:hypothetical protein